jgi:hypothetical protein
MLLTDRIATGAMQGSLTLNNDTGSNYSESKSIDGGSDATGTSRANMRNYNGWNTSEFNVTYVANLSSKEKLLTGHGVTDRGSGAGTANSRYEFTGKWANTSDAVNRIDWTNIESGSFDAGSECVVLGWDPTDTHTTNFWEELASVSGDGTSTTLSSGTITAKKYLWVQAYSNATSQDSAFQFNNDTASNYSTRWSDNGGADSTSTSESRIDLTFGSPSFTNMFIINNSANEKLCIHHQLDASTAGAGTAPRRYERVSKWANTSAQITEIDYINQSTSVNFPSGSILKVWGSN